MPIYEYACARCESEFEVEQRITEDPLQSCPQCRSRRIKRLISQTSFALKGGGWYADGYAPNGGAQSNSAKSDAAKSNGGDSASASASDGASPSGASGSEKKGGNAAKGKNAVA
jgi:putative FmdB family regulatory protein